MDESSSAADRNPDLHEHTPFPQGMSPSARVIGARIGAGREVCGLSQSALATKAGISVSEIQRIECGAANPSLDALCEIASIIGIPIVSLFRPESRTETIDHLGSPCSTP